MGYQVYRVGRRYGGYGVPTICEHPDCNKEIDRGMSYACGGEPFSEYGCDMYFCSEHVVGIAVTPEGELIKCDHLREDCDYQFYEVCKPCSTRDPDVKFFPHKPEHPDWVKHLLTDESWAQWREENPVEVEQMQELNNNI